MFDLDEMARVDEALDRMNDDIVEPTSEEGADE